MKGDGRGRVLKGVREREEEGWRAKVGWRKLVKERGKEGRKEGG